MLQQVARQKFQRLYAGIFGGDLHIGLHVPADSGVNYGKFMVKEPVDKGLVDVDHPPEVFCGTVVGKEGVVIQPRVFDSVVEFIRPEP